MCGVSGLIAVQPVPDGLRLVDAMVDAQAHRGPDHRDVVAIEAAGGASVILGHNRLSIIDLSPEANQPMWDAERRYCIVYNGEIYNYVEVRDELRALGREFRTASDTEVILEAFKAWGTDAFSRLNGMFALALVEPDAGRIWLVRDRFGVKPLFYHHTGGTLYFSSTPGELARQLGLRPNLEYVARGLHYWLYEDDGPISQYEGVNAVPAGTAIQAQATTSAIDLRCTRWYHLADRVEQRRAGLAEAHDTEASGMVLDLLTDAVRLRLRADVPVGISLSGGLDSASIAALLAPMHGDVTGFSYGRPDVRNSEGPAVARAARHARVSAEYVWPDAAAGIQAFWDTLAAQDAPFPGLSIVAQYLVFEAAHDQRMKVLLGGQGADEILMGYRKFQVMLLADALRRRDPASAVRFAWSTGLMLAAEANRAGVYLRQRQRYLRSGGLETSLVLPPPAPLDMAMQGDEPPWRRQVREVTRLSLPTLLRYEDRNSMGNSLETRLPFLDYRFVELALALPDRLKVRSGYGKWILREAMRGRVPASARKARAKRGFDAPEAAWLAAGLGASIRARLQEAGPNLSAWLPRGANVAELFADRRLASHPAAIGEATSLLWLAERS